MGKRTLAAVAVALLAFGLAAITASAGGSAAKLAVSARTAKCTDPLTNVPAKCWAAVTGNGLQPGTTVTLYTNGGSGYGTYGYFTVGSSGRISAAPEVLCNVGWQSAYAEGTTAAGAVIDSTFTDARC